MSKKESYLIDLKEHIVLYLIILATSFVFLLIHSTSTSPLYVGSLSDSAVFMMLGNFFLQGQIPYVDYFDHKGPVLIFMQALAQLINVEDRTSIFILQNIFLFFSLLIIYRLSRLFLDKVISYILLVITLCGYALVFDSGNMTEEYSLLFNLIPFYFIMKSIQDKSYTLKSVQLLIAGICCGLLFWIRMNNMAVAVACVLFVIVMRFNNKNWSGIGRIIGFSLVGFLIVGLPIVCYFYSLGALDEMIYANFTFNFEYAKYADEFEGNELPLSGWVRYLFVLLFPSITLAIGTAFHYAKYKKKEILILSLLFVIITLVSTSIGKKSSSYIMNAIPAFTLGLLLLLMSIDMMFLKRTWTKTFLLVLSITIFSGISALKINQNKSFNKTEHVFRGDVFDLLAHVPKDEVDQLYAYNTRANFLFVSKLKPYYRFFISQERHGAIDSTIFRDINVMMREKPPVWLVLEKEGNMSEANPHFFELRTEKFNLYYENDRFVLYRLKN